MRLMKNKKIFAANFSRKVIIPKTTTDFTSRVSNGYVPLTCKFPMVMHFVLVLHKWCGSKDNFYVFIYDKTSLKSCESFRSFLLNYARMRNQI